MLSPQVTRYGRNISNGGPNLWDTRLEGVPRDMSGIDPPPVTYNYTHSGIQLHNTAPTQQYKHLSVQYNYTCTAVPVALDHSLYPRSLVYGKCGATVQLHSSTT